MVNYSNGKIYQICCKDIDVKEIYVGSTTNLNRRRWEHKSCCNNEGGDRYNSYVYQFIRNNGNWENWNIIMVEEYEAVSKLDLHKRERYWVEELGATLNKQIPTRDKKEYYREHKVILAEKNKEYREKNKVILAKKGKEYREKNKVILAEKKKEYRENNKVVITEKMKEYYEKNKVLIVERGKKYREKNKVALAEKKKKYYEKNKVALAEKRKETYTCGCGSTITKTNKPTHEKSKKHMKFLK